MPLRSVVALTAIVLTMPALAGELRPDEARQFVAGKTFSYTCFEGTTGSGRINPDGSVVGSIRMRGTGKTYSVTLPPNTIRVSSTSVCASVRGVGYQPCFNVNQTDPNSFRGSVSGFSFAYCDFVRHHPAHVADAAPQVQPAQSSQPAQASQPRSLAPAIAKIEAKVEAELRTSTYAGE